MDPVERGFVSVGARRVHYRRAGEGPPLVMLHGSPGDGEVLAEEMAAAARAFTCFALDTPGFGRSDALPGETLTVRDLAAATAEAMAALRLPPCRIYGTHTGAAIAAELGAAFPDRVTGLVLEGLPVFTPEETTVLLGGTFAPMIADPLGGHLTATWVRFRDQFTWFPWFSRDVTRLNPVDRPTPQEVDLWVSMFYRACRSYGPAYRAACSYGQGAFEAARALRAPAVFMASAEDMLFPHLDRLPPLRDGQAIVRLPYDPAAKPAAITRLAAGLPGDAPAPARGASVLAGSDPAKGFVDTPDGELFVRAYGRPDRPCAVLLHGAPGTGLALERLARELAEETFVVVPDMPGTGESAAPEAGRDLMEAARLGVAAVADTLDLKAFIVAGVGCGCAVASDYAARGDPRLRAVVLADVPGPHEAPDEVAAPTIELSPEGAHWVKAWLMIRDNEIYDPWFDGRVSAQRRTQGEFGADWLHDQTVALMTSRASQHRYPRAARRFDVEGALTRVCVPVARAGAGGLGETVRATLLHHGTAAT
jgi:pimeloyl-ACP methyl ester carboxylesterase